MKWRLALATRLRPRLRIGRTIAVFVLAVLLIESVEPLDACGPFRERAVFTFRLHPDFPLTRFAGGELGVLQPTYARSYLAVAYRYLAGAPLGAEAREAAAQLWRERLQMSWDERPEKAADAWRMKRGNFPDVTPLSAIDFFRRVPGAQFSSYQNCLADAFRRATLTLDGLATAHGASNPIVSDWIRSQDIVFENCARGDRRPAALASGLGPDARAHRQYQIAAATFYAGELTEAEAMFRAIATDASSPWRTLGRYLAARAIIRRATLLPGEGEVDLALLARASAELQAILQDSTLAPIHPAAAALVGFVRFRLEPKQRLTELAQAVTAPNAGAGFRQDLLDYALMLDKVIRDGPPASLDSVPAFARADAVTDWIITFQTPDRAATDYAIERWETTTALPWLVAAASKIDTNDPRATAIVAAAAKIRTDSPAFTSLAYHAARLRIAGGQLDAARADLDRALGTGSVPLPPSARNELLALRTTAAASFEEFLHFAQREPAATMYEGDGTERPIDAKESRLAKTPDLRVFDEDGTAILNDRLPLARLARGATMATLPAHLRRRLAIAAWTRALLLGDDGIARSVGPVLAQHAVEMRAGLTEYASLTDANARALTALVLILEHPGTRPFVMAGLDREAAIGRLDNYRDNWWCADAPSPVESPAALVNAVELATARGERARLTKTGPAPNYLASEAVRLATARPDDPNSPKALHLAVRATRYGCTDERTGAASRRAFDLLHKRYAGSDWARRTPYWFGGG